MTKNTPKLTATELAHLRAEDIPYLGDLWTRLLAEHAELTATVERVQEFEAFSELERAIISEARAMFSRSPQWFREHLPTLHEMLSKVERAEVETVMRLGIDVPTWAAQIRQRVEDASKP